MSLDPLGICIKCLIFIPNSINIILFSSFTEWQCLMLIIDSCIIFPFVLKYYRSENGNVIGYSPVGNDVPRADILPMRYKPSEIQRMISNKSEDDKKEADKLRSMTL